jgi:hypothetical protein
MKPGALPIAALAMLGGTALATADGSSTPARPETGDWIISRTTSPVDYAQIATATASSREHAGDSAMQLSIRCRGGRTELEIAGPGISGRGEDYLISYRVGSGAPVQVAASTAAFGPGVAIKIDPIAMLQSLPGEGELAVHLSSRGGTAQDGVFSLAGLDTVRAKMKAACKWPDAVPKPGPAS